MAIEDILRTLEDQAQADCDECLAEADSHAKHILSEAQREAQTIRERYSAQVERAAKTKAAQKVNAARLESKMKVSAVKGDGLEAVFADAGERLGSIRERADYGQVFARLFGEAVAETEGERLIKVNPADAELAQRLVDEGRLEARVEADESIVGGVLVELEGGRILRRNTLEDRLNRARELVQDDVARVLLA